MAGKFNDETFRDDFSFCNSERAIRRFPFPFHQDSFRYSVNMEQHRGGPEGSIYEKQFDVDEHYLSEMRERALVLASDPLRCQSMPHMRLAEWDLLELIMVSASTDDPDLFTLHRDAKTWRWINRPMGIDDTFTFMDGTTLPFAPMEYITRQMQGDFCLLDQRDGNLWMDAGMVTSQADWSLDFDLGMNFFEWHAPVPVPQAAGIFERALIYLLQVRQGIPARRLGWSMTVNPRLDTATETSHAWGAYKRTLTPESIGAKLHLRVEVQSFHRLPRSNALAFSIRTYLCSFEDVTWVPKWGRRLHRVIRDLPDEVIRYKGISETRTMMLDYLARFDDGQPTSPGIWPELETEPPFGT